MSSDRREALIAEVVLAVRAHQSAVDEVDEAAANFLGVNRTDLRCLDILDRGGRLSAGELASGSGLTSGAITSVIDRLERAGYVRRLPHDSDRRRVLVELTDEAQRRSGLIYGPIAQSAQPLLEHCSDDELAFVRDFMQRGRDILLQNAATARALSEPAHVPEPAASEGHPTVSPH